MAIWQYSFIVIPRDSLSDFKKQPNRDKAFDDEIYWLNIPTDPKLFYEIGEILPRVESWSKNLIIYGNDTSNCFEILSENNRVASISFRVDFTSNYEKVLGLVLEFLLLNGFFLLDENYNNLSGNYLEAKGVIESSHQFSLYEKLSKGT